MMTKVYSYLLLKVCFLIQLIEVLCFSQRQASLGGVAPSISGTI